jgi:hypothetical protein
VHFASLHKTHNNKEQVGCLLCYIKRAMAVDFRHIHCYDLAENTNTVISKMNTYLANYFS